MMKLLVVVLLAAVGWAKAQDEGRCECGVYVTVQYRGIVPPYSREIGPLYLLDDSDVMYPCTGNTASVCAQYCDALMSAFVADGGSLDDIVEIEVAPDVYENETLGQVMCTRSYQLQPDSGYDGTVEDGAPLLMYMQLDPCENWENRGCYADLPLCCDRNYQYSECPAADVSCT